MARRVLPGFPLSLSYTLAYLGLLVIVPLVACLVKTSSLSWEAFSAAVWTDRARAAYAFTFGAAFAAAVASIVLGLLVAWVLVRYDFPLKRLFDSLVDLPFALPTAVAGLGLLRTRTSKAAGWDSSSCRWASRRPTRGWASCWCSRSSACRSSSARCSRCWRVWTPKWKKRRHLLGATRWQTFRRVILPALLAGHRSPALRWRLRAGLGEYGSVVFVSGNMPFKTEIAPVLIVARLEEFAYAEATAIAVVLLVMSFGDAGCDQPARSAGASAMKV